MQSNFFAFNSVQVDNFSCKGSVKTEINNQPLQNNEYFIGHSVAGKWLYTGTSNWVFLNGAGIQLQFIHQSIYCNYKLDYNSLQIGAIWEVWQPQVIRI